MNKKSNRLSLAAGVAAISLFGAACASSTTTESAATTAAAAQAAATTAAATEPAATEASTEPAVTEAAAEPAATEAAAPTDDLAGDIAVDGSSTVAPLVTLAAEDFMAKNSGVNVTVGTSGTGGGFEKFCAGETDISTASRAIKDEETAKCAEKGVEYIELLVANDGIAVVVNNDNDWVECMTVEQLNKMWGAEADKTVTNWNQVDPAFADQALALFGPGTDSGTFDYFTKAINGKEKVSRTDYSPSENDNDSVTGVKGNAGGLGYFGLSYFEENADDLKALAIDGGKGCVEPSTETVQDGTYAPLSRPLYVYVKVASAVKPEVKAFIDYIVAEQGPLAEEALFVPLAADQLADQAAELAKVDAT